MQVLGEQVGAKAAIEWLDAHRHLVDPTQYEVTTAVRLPLSPDVV